MIREVTDAVECRELWESLSPRARIWDDWDLMAAYHDENACRFLFLAVESGGRATGLVPLVFNASLERGELFGGSYPDSRVLWIDNSDWPACFDALPNNTVFFDLDGRWVDALLEDHPDYAPHFVETDRRFYLCPEDFSRDFMNHIRSLGGDTRQGLLYDLRKVEQLRPERAWSRSDEVDTFIRLVNARFGAESDYATADGQAELRRVTSVLAEKGWLRTLVLAVDGTAEAVSLSAMHGDTWTALYASSNHTVKNLGKLLTVETIQRASREGAREINYMTGMAWKAAWGMKWAPARTFRKTPGAGTGPGSGP
ncbi:MAG: GNAT family N-acetyltransferase [Xanthomonadales bacterium]|jgi:hypothetical protein|nr:GNAT family N-acetyltransferase [Xanthomonadales bacterium]